MKPGLRQAEEEHVQWPCHQERAHVTPEWIAQNNAKQRAYEQQREEWRALVGIKLDE
jgi:hypothetical protein